MTTSKRGGPLSPIGIVASGVVASLRLEHPLDVATATAPAILRRPEHVAEPFKAISHRVRALASIPERFQWAAFDAFGADRDRMRVKLPRAVVVRVYRLRAEPFVTLVGPSSAGKTSLACAVVRAWAEDGKPARFVSAEEIYEAQRGWIFGSPVPEIIRIAKRTARLVLDDVGQELNATPRNDAVAAVLRHRHNADLTTWITTYTPPDRCAEHYGDGVSRRIFDDAQIVELGSEAGPERRAPVRDVRPAPDPPDAAISSAVRAVGRPR